MHLQLTVLGSPSHRGYLGALHEWETAKVPPWPLEAQVQVAMFDWVQTILLSGGQVLTAASIKENKAKIINSTKACFINK